MRLQRIPTETPYLLVDIYDILDFILGVCNIVLMITLACMSRCNSVYMCVCLHMHYLCMLFFLFWSVIDVSETFLTTCHHQ